MPLAADDDVIVDDDAEQPAGFGDQVGDLDVGAARLGRARGVVVDEDQRGGAQVQRAADHFARVDRRLVDRTVADVLVVDQHVLVVKAKHSCTDMPTAREGAGFFQRVFEAVSLVRL